MIVKNLPPILATAKSHLHQEIKNLQSTKPGSSYKDQLEKIRNKIRKLEKDLPPGKTFRDALEEDMFNDAFP